MQEDEVLRQSPSQDVNSSTSPRPTTYDLLMRQSRKMGSLATRTFNRTKELISADKKRTYSASKNESNQRKGPMLFGKLTESQSHGVDPKEARAITKIVERSHEVLAGARTVPLPTNLFPDSVIIDRTKVTITRRTFFWTSQVITMRIEDVLSVTSNFGPLFGSILIATRIMNSTDHFEVNYFWRKDAEYIKQILQGYVIAQHNEIETKHLTKQELIETLLELGRDSSL